MRQILFIALLLAITIVPAFSQEPGDLKNGERPFSGESVRVIAGSGWGGWGSGLEHYENQTISVKSLPYDGYVKLYDNHWTTFDIRGWDRFIALAGINDNRVGSYASLTIEVDGNLVTKITVRHGEKPQLIDIPLTACSTLTLRWTDEMVLITPRMVKGNPAPLFACQQCGGTFSSQKALADHIKANHAGGTVTGGNPPPGQPASFVTDPKDLEQLAVALRKRVDTKPDLQAKLANGFMAVMTFNLIDIPSPSVAQNVAEDMSTKLINADFQLVERGQLDKALKELKIQDSALIDQATAQKLGQITGCNFILVGSVSDRGQFIVINARILETATGKAVAAESVECRKIPIQR
ncbi:MAG: FlgO family outer membrane protein [Armatimonadota bacterium]